MALALVLLVLVLVPGDRCGGQRQPQLDRRRRPVPPAAGRGRQARARRCGAPRSWPASGTGSTSGASCSCRCCPVAARGPRPRPAAGETWAPRSCSWRSPVALLFVVGAPLRLFGLLGAAALSGGRLPVGDRAAPARPVRHLAEPVARGPARQRAAVPARAVRAGQRRLVGARARARAGRSGVGCPRRTPTSSTPSSARSSAWPARSRCCCCSRVLVYAGVRIALRTTDPFVRLAASGATAWIGTQALVNIGAVLGLLPIAGLPLPLVSYGGAALLITLVAIGMLMSFARTEPGAAEALAGPARRSARSAGTRSSGRSSPVGDRGARRARRRRDRRTRRAGPGRGRRAATPRPGRSASPPWAPRGVWRTRWSRPAATTSR